MANGAYGLHIGGKFFAVPSTPGGCATYLEIIGNGTSDGIRSNARMLDNQGNETLAGNLTVVGTPTNDNHAITLAQAKTLLSNFVDEYDSTQTYNIGDKCFYNLITYEANTNITTAEAFDPNKWTKIKLI